MTIELLSTGYFLARWHAEAFAQWPKDRELRREDFFNPDWTFTEARQREAQALVPADEAALRPLPAPGT